MSNYCESCHYDRVDKTGGNACPFNSLYWDFHDRHRAKLERLPRLRMVYSLWDKMKPDDREAILLKAADYLEKLEGL